MVLLRVSGTIYGLPIDRSGGGYSTRGKARKLVQSQWLQADPRQAAKRERKIKVYYLYWKRDLMSF